MMQKRHEKALPWSQMLSIPHLIIVFIVALVVFGPEKLPELARNLGKIMGEFKRTMGDLRSTFEGHLRDLEREADQRRMRNESEIAATASSSATPPLSPASPMPGSVATTPPHILGAASLSEAPSSASGHDSVENATVAEAATREQPAPALEPQHNPETLTDAGIHPA